MEISPPTEGLKEPAVVQRQPEKLHLNIFSPGSPKHLSSHISNLASFPSSTTSPQNTEVKVEESQEYLFDCWTVLLPGIYAGGGEDPVVRYDLAKARVERDMPMTIEESHLNLFWVIPIRIPF